MDHLEYPQDCLPLDIQIPLVATEKYCDAVAFDSFPSKRGFRFAQGRISSKEILRHGPARAIAFIQEWMWFGPLKFTLGDSFVFKDFVRQDATTGRNIVSTQRLKEWMLERKDAMVDDTVPALCRKMLGICDILDRTDTSQAASAGWAKDWAAVWLSIRVLIETLLSLGKKSKRSHHRTRTGAPPKNAASWQLLVSTMLGRPGWCVHQIDKFREVMSFTAVVYIGSLKRYPKPWVDHDKCQSEKTCVALNIDKSSFDGVHVEPGCTCTAIETPAEEMHDIVATGGVAYVQCARATNGELRLMYRRATPCTRYVALSHLWADGIGNPHGNIIYQCQLEKIVERVALADAAISRIRVIEGLPGIFPGHHGLRRQLLKSQPSKLPRGYVVNFWLDALCVPVVSTEHDSRRMLSLRLKALSNLPLTYSMASGVLAIDQELDHITPDMDEAEVTARIAVSGINTRCWTYHEATFGRLISYWCGHGPIAIAPWTTMPSPKRYKQLELIPSRDTSDKALRLARNWYPLLDTPCPRTLGKEMNLIEREKSEQTSKKSPKLTHGDKLRLFLSESINLSRNPARNGYRLTGKNWSPDAIRGRLYNNRVVRFGYVWNALRARNSTITEDTVITLANLLDLDALDIVAMHPEQRMKAILRAYRCFPADLLFASGVDRLSGEGGSNWVPAHPLGSESLTFREWRGIKFNSRAERISSPGLAHNAVEITPDGVLLKHLTIVVEPKKQPKKPKTFPVGKDVPIPLDSSDGQAPKTFSVPWKVVKLHGPLVAAGYFHLNGKDIWGKPDAAFYHFKLERREAATSQPGSAGNILLILNYPRGAEAEHKSNCNGCAVIRTGMKDKIARSTYACPLSWYRVPDMYAKQSGNLFEAEVLDELDVLICSDIAHWPRTRLRPNVFSKEPREENVAIYGLVYAAPFGAALGVGLAMADQYHQLVPDAASRTLVSLAITFHAAALLSACLQFLLHCFRSAQHWLVLLDYQSREDRELPWWAVLYEASPDADSVLAFGSGKSAWYFTSVIVSICRACDALWRACGYSGATTPTADLEPEIELHEIRQGVWTKNGSSAIVISSSIAPPPVVRVVSDEAEVAPSPRR
ncbi:hypothetical protein AC578_8149 [Pseudocercospora eumusae]|uniref:Heterokaryon incompatibility domain-containing protein n=1 Tax=Pseudocercospora eumusae TaxID=321146 RepID=A0A139HAG2_9PEZI|nr:hypothetical protein AC578_8149 [Pseudocercospora eumusae]